VALLTRELKASGGVVISASHNPPEYNGIKFFNAEGYKLSVELEDQLEAALQSALEQGRAGLAQTAEAGSLPTGIDVGRAQPIEDAHERYISFAVDTLKRQQLSLKGLTIALDCGNGASSFTSPEAFRRLGAKVVVINDEGDGAIINVDSGSTNLDQLARLVAESKADVGIAHDGDADRTIALSSSGVEVDGDFIEAITALDRKATRGIPGNTVVSTVMCNIGFVQAMEKAGLKVVQTPVGDANVLAVMREKGYVIGGEQSGHTIFSEYNTTGDGLITALMLLAALQRSGKSLDILAAEAMCKYPQSLINVHVANKQLLNTNEAIAAAIKAGEAELEESGGGRVLVRASGTEPLVRVMVEAASEDTALRVASSLASTVENELQ
jgi:phosphoglucosamine mutase